MPPKNTGSAAHEATITVNTASIPNMALTPSETKMLAAVCTLIGDAPDVNYKAVASMCGIKHPRNARSNAKKLFAKIKASNPDMTEAAAGSQGAGSDNEGAEADGDAIDEEAPAKRANRGGKKDTTKPAEKKGVGKAAAPKKIAAAAKKTAASAKKAGAGKGAGKAKKAAVKAKEEALECEIVDNSDEHADVEDCEDEAMDSIEKDED